MIWMGLIVFKEGLAIVEMDPYRIADRISVKYAFLILDIPYKFLINLPSSTGITIGIFIDYNYQIT